MICFQVSSKSQVDLPPTSSQGPFKKSVGLKTTWNWSKVLTQTCRASAWPLAHAELQSLPFVRSLSRATPWQSEPRGTTGVRATELQRAPGDRAHGQTLIPSNWEMPRLLAEVSNETLSNLKKLMMKHDFLDRTSGTWSKGTCPQIRTATFHPQVGGP